MGVNDLRMEMSIENDNELGRARGRARCFVVTACELLHRRSGGV